MTTLDRPTLRMAVIRGHALSPLNPDQMELFHASSKVRVLEAMIKLVADAGLYVAPGDPKPFLAYVSNRDGLGRPC